MAKKAYSVILVMMLLFLTATLFSEVFDRWDAISGTTSLDASTVPSDSHSLKASKCAIDFAGTLLSPDLELISFKAMANQAFVSRGSIMPSLFLAISVLAAYASGLCWWRKIRSVAGSIVGGSGLLASPFGGNSPPAARA